MFDERLATAEKGVRPSTAGPLLSRPWRKERMALAAATASSLGERRGDIGTGRCGFHLRLARVALRARNPKRALKLFSVQTVESHRVSAIGGLQCARGLVGSALVRRTGGADLLNREPSGGRSARDKIMKAMLAAVVSRPLHQSQPRKPSFQRWIYINARSNGPFDTLIKPVAGVSMSKIK